MTKEIIQPIHGEFKIKMKQLNSEANIVHFDCLVKPLTQEEIADGWIQVLRNKKKVIHHFSIYLSQLPLNLWARVKKTYTNDNSNDYYKKIKDHNYHYSIKFTTNDENILKLYKNIMSITPDLIVINELYKGLDENRVKGWVMIKAKNMINQ
jgi:hypothetical protein